MASSASVTRYTFVVDYFDPCASLTRSYLFVYHLDDNTIEMFDLKTRRVFLKRCAYPALQPTELFVGATINVHARPLKVVDYGDDATRRCLSANLGEFVLAIAPSGVCVAGHIVSALTNKQLRISSICMLDAAVLADVLPPSSSSSLPSTTTTRLTEGKGAAAASMRSSNSSSSRSSTQTQRSIVVVVSGAGAEAAVHEVCAAFAGQLHVLSQSAASVRDVARLRASARTTARMRGCTVCVVKPHAITSGQQGAILQRLLDEGFDVTALASYTLSVADAEDLLEVYCGVVPEYKRLVEQLSSGVCWAVEVCGENAVAALRAVCGPHDPEVCHVLFPHTLRAQYGVDRVRNAVHCTDLDEDGPLESEFFFALMHKKVAAAAATTTA